jgi:hypothetical protein
MKLLGKNPGSLNLCSLFRLGVGIKIPSTRCGVSGLRKKVFHADEYFLYDLKPTVPTLTLLASFV